MSLAAADFDEDGDLDVYACCYSQRATSPLMGRPVPYHDANNGGRNLLFRNDGRWRFQDVTRQVGLDENNRRFSFAACWEDYDNDGDLDLYVANDYGRNNLYENSDDHMLLTYRSIQPSALQSPQAADMPAEISSTPRFAARSRNRPSLFS